MTPVLLQVSNNETETVLLTVPMSFKAVDGLKAASGRLQMNHMDRGRLHAYRDLEVDLAIYFGGDSEDICLEVTAPKRLIDDLNKGHAPGKCAAVNRATPAWTFESHSSDHLPHDWCQGNQSQPLTFNYEPQADWVVYVKPEGRDLIKLHLMCTSAFLFVLAFVMVAFAALRAASNANKGQQLLQREDFD